MDIALGICSSMFQGLNHFQVTTPESCFLLACRNKNVVADDMALRGKSEDRERAHQVGLEATHKSGQQRWRRCHRQSAPLRRGYSAQLLGRPLFSSASAEHPED